MSKKVSILVGSLRKGSFARKVAQNVIPMFPKGYEARIVEIGHSTTSTTTTPPKPIFPHRKATPPSAKPSKFQTAFCSLPPKTTAPCPPA